MSTKTLDLLSDYERGIVRQALFVAAMQFKEDASSNRESPNTKWLQKVAADMLSIRNRIEGDPKTGW